MTFPAQNPNKFHLQLLTFSLRDITYHHSPFISSIYSFTPSEHAWKSCSKRFSSQLLCVHELVFVLWENKILGWTFHFRVSFTLHSGNFCDAIYEDKAFCSFLMCIHSLKSFSLYHSVYLHTRIVYNKKSFWVLPRLSLSSSLSRQRLSFHSY